MKTHSLSGVFIKASFCAVLIPALAATSIRAANLLQTINTASQTGSNWVLAVWGSPAGLPVSANTYETPNGFGLRTENQTAPQTFPGNSLQIDTGGILYLKHGNGVATANLVLAGGAIDFHGTGSGTNSPIGGTLQVTANSLFESDQTGSANLSIWVMSPISGSGSLSVNADDASHGVFLFGTNSAYSGNWTNVTGIIEVMSGSSNALGSGSVTLNFGTSTFLVFNSAGSMVISNSISGLGNVIQENSGEVTLAGTNTFTGYVEITNNSILQIGAGSSLTNASAINLVRGTLDASLIGGLTLGPAQNMACNGTVVGSLTVPGANTLSFNFTATTNSVLNITGALTLDQTANLNVTAAGFITPGTYRLINYSGTIQGGGSFNLIPPAGSNETFQLDTSTPGQVNLIVTGAVNNITWVGDGSLNNWDLTTADWTGSTNVYADGDNVTFNDSGSAAPFINVAVTVHPGSMTISNTANYYTFSGLGIAMSGSFIKEGTNEVDLISASNGITGPVTIQDGILSLGNGGITASLGNPSSITNHGVLEVDELNNGVSINSPISGPGSFIVTGGGASVSLGGANSYTGTTTIDGGCQLNISSSFALGNPASVVTVQSGGRLGVNTLVGSMTIPQPLVINGTGISGAPGAIYVNSSGNNVTWSGPVTIASSSQIRAVNVNVRDTFSNAVLGTNVALECTSGNTAGDSSTIMTFANAVSLGSGGSLSVDGLAMVVLGGGTNSWDSGTIVSGGTLLVNGTLQGGSLSVNNPATVGGTGVISDPVVVDGTVAPGASGIGTLTVSNSVTINSDGTLLISINRSSAQNASVLSAASVNYNGSTLTVTNIGSANLQAGDSFTLLKGGFSGTFAVTNLPTLPSPNLYWDASLLNSQGVLKIGSTVVPQPSITGIHVSGTTLTLTGTGGENGGRFVLLESTNITLPLNQWTPVLTNNFDGGGNLNLTTNIITPGTPQQFYILSQ